MVCGLPALVEPSFGLACLFVPLSSPPPSRRRGAAFGLAGLVKGLGIMAMKSCGIMDALKVWGSCVIQQV